MSQPHARAKSMAQKILAGCGLLLALTPSAHADDHGCKVLLCLANPNGPRAVAECVPDINKLFHDLAKGRGFPTCAMASAPETGAPSWAQQGYSYYDPCPAGTSALAEGQLAIQGDASTPKRVSNPTFYEGIGEGDGFMPFEDRQLGKKVCVGNKVGSTMFRDYENSRFGYGYTTAGVYDHVAILDPQDSPRIIDVYVSNTLYRRVRW